MKEYLQKFDRFYLSLLIIVLSIITSITVYNIHENGLKANNMNKAIEKGIDPLAVRCSYAHSQDLICVAFAASAQSHNMSSNVKR